MKTPIIFSAIVPLLVCSCAPQREFPRFENAGTFHPGPQHSGSQFRGPEGEYDSYELVDHGGVPNHGIPPMYSGAHPQEYAGYNDGGYPKAVDTYDQYGNRQTMIIPNPW